MSEEASRVGHQHHYVARSYLARFADSSMCIRRTNRTTRQSVVTHIKNVATERDFYTYRQRDGTLDASMEGMLGQVEASGITAIRQICNPLIRQPLDPSTRSALRLYMATQLVRGRTKRRELEEIHSVFQSLLGDGFVELHDPERGPYLARKGHSNDLEGIEASDDPNGHISLIQPIAMRLYYALEDWRFFLFDLNENCLLTSDEPVSIYQEDHTRPYAIGNADEIRLPLDRRRVLILARPDRVSGLPEGYINSSPSFADNINACTIATCYEHVFSHPEFDLSSIDFPPPGPLLMIGGAESYVSQPRGVRTRRRRR